MSPVWTGADGRFEFQGLSGTSYRLRFAPHWIVGQVAEAPFLFAQLDDLEPGGPELEVVLPRGVAIHGRLVRADGTPLVDHEVRPASDVRTTGLEVRTDVEGRFTLAVSRGTVCDLEFRAPGAAWASEPLHTERGVPGGALEQLIVVGG